MISTLRRRFIFGGMIAMMILLFLLVSTICIGGYIMLEKTSSSFMSAILNGESAPNGDASPNEEVPNESARSTDNKPPMTAGMPGRNDRMYRGFYLVSIDSNGEIINIDSRGIWEEDLTEAESLTQQALATGKSRGRLSGQYKFMLQKDDTGTRLILLDDYPQLRTLKNVFAIACVFSLICLVGMFLILLPVSARIVKSYVQNTEQQKQFITNAGHELKTPVAIILSNLDAMELILGENKWSRNIRGQTSRLNALLHRLLFMARMDERSLRLHKESFDLSELIQTESDSYGEAINEKKLQLSSNIPQTLPVHGSREYICQLLHVLMDNAVQYSPESGWIKIDLNKRRRTILLSIENSVAALPDCEPQTLFDRFYRGDSAHSQSGGHGIGLSAAKAIAEMHGGKLNAEYKENSIRFTVELKA